MKPTPSTDLQFEGKKISKKKVLKIWKSVTDKPFPFAGIEAFLLRNEEMDRVLSLLEKSPNIKVQGVWEYGKKLGVEGSDAVVFLAELVSGHKDYCILIREQGNFTLEENLKHELEHIARGEVRVHKKEMKGTIHAKYLSSTMHAFKVLA